MHSKKSIFISIVIPAYNEENRLENTLNDVIRYLRIKNLTFEIIVVSDGSTDRTAEIVNRVSRSNPEVKLLENQENMGKGFSVRKGMLHTSGEWNLFMDADNATKIIELEKFIPFITEYDVIIGSIGLKNSIISTKESFIRTLGGKIGNRIIRFMVLPGITDTQRGFKLFSRRSLDLIFPNVKTTGWAFDVEVLALALKNNFSIKEVPIKWSHKNGSRVGLRSYFEVLVETIKLRIRIGKVKKLNKS